MNASRVAAPWGAESTSRSRTRPGTTSHNSHVLRGIQIAIAVLAIGMAVIGALLFDTDGTAWVYGSRWLVRELVPGVVTFALVGVLVLRNRRAAAVGWAMLAAALCWGGSALAAGLYVGWSFAAQPFVVSHFLGGLGYYVGTMLLPQLFPTGWLRGWVWRVLLVVTALLILALQSLEALANWESFVIEDVAPLDFDGVGRFGTVVWFFTLAVVVAGLAQRVWRGPQLVRQQVAPLAIVWLLVIAGEDLRAAEYELSSSSWAFLARWLWPVVMALTIGLTLTRVGLWDTRLVIRRFGVYATVVAVLTVIFVGVYFAVLMVLSSQAVDDRYRWLALLLAAVAVIAAEPLRHRVRAGLERRLLGSRGDPLRPLARLDALSSAADADDEQVYRTITETAAQAVRAPGVALALHQPTGVTVVGVTGSPDDDPLVIPLLHRGERLGELRVTSRTPGELYGRSDRALLDRLAHQAAALAYGLRRESDIARLRNDGIEALVAQRTALGRDLHDGLAPLLAGAGLTADALRRGMSDDSSDAGEAARLASRLRAAITNVVRHAQATLAEVSLQRIGSEVVLQVSDNGRGIAQPYVSGLGITSMRSRVQALGGVFELTPRDGGGTVLSARVPVRENRVGADREAAG